MGGTDRPLTSSLLLFNKIKCVQMTVGSASWRPTELGVERWRQRAALLSVRLSAEFWHTDASLLQILVNRCSVLHTHMHTQQADLSGSRSTHSELLSSRGVLSRSAVYYENFAAPVCVFVPENLLLRDGKMSLFLQCVLINGFFLLRDSFISFICVSEPHPSHLCVLFNTEEFISFWINYWILPTFQRFPRSFLNLSIKV